MYDELSEVYNVDLIGNPPPEKGLKTIQERSESEQEEVEEEEDQPAQTPHAQDGKRKRKPNRKYLSSPSKPRKKRAKGRKAMGKVQLPASLFKTELAGSMLRMLVQDEIAKLLKDAYDLHNSLPGEKKVVSSMQQTVTKKGENNHAFDYYSDSEEGTQAEPAPAKPDELDIEEEICAMRFETNPDSLSVIEWWKKYAAKYPYHALVARRLCAVRATSSESERDFSVSGQISSKLR